MNVDTNVSVLTTGVFIDRDKFISYKELSDVLTVLGVRQLLRETIIIDALASTHAASTFREAGRILSLVPASVS